MTQIAHICKHLLRGDVLTIMDGFKLFACSNLPRELSRSVEQKFGVELSRTPVKFTSKYGHSGEYYQYRLNHTQYNADGIKKMRDYVSGQLTEQPQAQKQSNPEKDKEHQKWFTEYQEGKHDTVIPNIPVQLSLL